MKPRSQFFFSLTFFLTFVACSQAAITARAQNFEVGRVTIPLLTDWTFHKGSLETKAANALEVDGKDWESVTLPHTWNALDGEDGGMPYFRGDGWYRRNLDLPTELQGKELFLRFDGANRRAEVFLNGQRVGEHSGGTEAFVFNITLFMKPGKNSLVVHVDNKKDLDSPPLQADFTFFGGLYRSVELIGVSPVHISLTDYASPGVYITTPEINETAAKVHVKTLLEQTATAGSIPRQLDVQIRDASGKTVAREVTSVPAMTDGTCETATDLMVPSPHLWNGVLDPYLYSVLVSVEDSANKSDKPLDAVTQPLGIRTIAIDPEKGFILNGRPYALHGVSRHQDRKDKGWAISNEDHLEDMAIIKEMGCTGIRLPHYQHAEFFYQLCDKEGLVAWAEIPVVDRLGSSKAFTENARQQYMELIHQNFNHPSIAFWSSGNEVDESGGNFNKKGPEVYPWFKQMGILEHQQDPSRIAAAAYRERFFPPPDTTDVFGLNIYLGWYNNTFDDIEEYVRKHEENGARGKWAVTEYGAGASIYFHSETPVRMDHTEEYQNLYHEKNWKVLSKHPEIWGKYVWNIFDFASDGRAEGDHAGINDKGLVTYDRKIKKDAFYFYKANWSSEPTLYITSRRFDVRGVDKIPIKVYSNAPTVALTVDGQFIGEKLGEDAVFTWDSIDLKEGPNVVRVTARFPDGRIKTDETTFTYKPGTSREIYVEQDDIMRKAYQNRPPRDYSKKPVATGPMFSQQ